MPVETNKELLEGLVAGGDALVTVLRKMLTDPYDHRNEAQSAIRSWQSPKVVALHRIANS